MKNEPYNKGGGKRIDPRLFEEYFMKYISGQVNQKGFSEGVGLSEPTLRKRIYFLMENGYLDGKYLTDDQPLIIGLNGFTRGEEPKDEPKVETKVETKVMPQKEVIYPKLL